MITPITLHDALCDFLKKEVADKQQFKSVDRNNNVVFKNPQIVRTGWVMPKSIDTGIDFEEDFFGEEDTPNVNEQVSITEEYPYIIPRLGKLETTKGTRESVQTVEIAIGIYNPGTYDDKGQLVDDGSAHRDFWNLVEMIRQALFSHLVIEKKYRLQDDYFEADSTPEQIYPYWEGYCEVKFDVMYPLPQLDPKFY